MATFGQLISFGPYFSGGNLTTLKIYHYITGTTTLLDVYTDREKTTTEAQPALSDANGIVTFFADGLYKFRIDAATDGVIYSTLYTIDKWAVTDQSSSLVGEGAAIASASTLTLGTDGNIFHVTGSTGPIIALSGAQPTVTLIFDSTPTLTHSGNLILFNSANYVAANGDVLVFFNEGAGVWREVSRRRAAVATARTDLGVTAFGTVTIAAKGDLAVGTAASTAAALTVGAAGSIPMSRAAATTGLAYAAALSKQIYGLTYDNGTDATNDLNINTGGCMDATGAYWMTLATALGKQSDVAWAVGGTVGTPLGGLDTGAVGDSDYYIWLICRSDTGVVDALFSLSSTAPIMPTNYDFKRLIGWFKRVGGTIVAFTIYETEGGGIELLWTAPTLDVDLAATLTTAERTDPVKVPLNFSVIAHLNVVITDAAVNQVCWVYTPGQTSAVPSVTAAPLANAISQTTLSFGDQIWVRTSATGTIAARCTTATADQYKVSTMGFTWARRP